ncbi:MAG TPA: hypothetical protein VIO14_05645 [Dehalococcoidia bacterium]
MATEHQHAATAQAQPWFTKTFVSRVMRSAAVKSGGWLEVLTGSLWISGEPVQESEFRELWNRTREQITQERHNPESRIPEIQGGDVLELRKVTVRPLSGEREQHFDRLVVFTEDIVAITATSGTSGNAAI